MNTSTDCLGEKINLNKLIVVDNKPYMNKNNMKNEIQKKNINFRMDRNFINDWVFKMVFKIFISKFFKISIGD